MFFKFIYSRRRRKLFGGFITNEILAEIEKDENITEFDAFKALFLEMNIFHKPKMNDVVRLKDKIDRALEKDSNKS